MPLRVRFALGTADEPPTELTVDSVETAWPRFDAEERINIVLASEGIVTESTMDSGVCDQLWDNLGYFF